MKRLERVAPGKFIRAEDINQLIDALNELHNISVGPGLTKRQTAGGVNFALQYPRGGGRQGPAGTPGTPEECSRIGPLPLGQIPGTQDTDTWTKDGDGTPVNVHVITDVQYKTDTHKLQFRVRTLKFDSCGKLYEITAEGVLWDIATAVVCT